MQNAPADVVKVDQFAFGDGQRQRRSNLLMPGSNLVGRRHRHWEEIRIHIPQLLDYATEPPVFCESLVVLGIEFLVGYERAERDRLTDLRICRKIASVLTGSDSATAEPAQRPRGDAEALPDTAVPFAYRLASWVFAGVRTKG